MEDRKLLNDDELEQIAGGAGTSVGMANWAQRAYHEGWPYVWGGAMPGAVDASGLISSYAGTAHNAEAMFAAAPAKGSMSTMPDIPGLGLYMPGHVGVYVGDGMVVCALNKSEGVVCNPLSSLSWTQWFQIPEVAY